MLRTEVLRLTPSAVEAPFVDVMVGSVLDLVLVDGGYEVSSISCPFVTRAGDVK